MRLLIPVLHIEPNGRLEKFLTSGRLSVNAVCISFTMHSKLAVALFMPCVALGEASKRTWGTAVQRDPNVKGILVYCDTIKATQSECANKFLGVGDDRGSTTSVVSRRAAESCLNKQRLTGVQAIMKMFNVDTNEMSNYASGGSSSHPPPKNYHYEYSDEARDQARKIGWKRQTEADAAMRAIERDEPWWSKTFHEENGRPEQMIIISETIIDIWSAYSAAKKAGDDPASVGVPPDRLVPNGAGTDKGNTNPDSPPEKDPEKPPEEKPPPDNVSEDDSDGSGSEFDATAEDVDIKDDIEATPVLQDETTRTAMQRCQESEEQKLWKAIGVTETDPNAQPLHDEADAAERLKRLGACDKQYYGEEACNEWKQDLWKEPLRPEEQDQLNGYKKRSSVCPGNAVSREDCNAAKQELFKHYVLPDVMEAPVQKILVPGLTVPWMPPKLGLGEVKLPVGVKPKPNPGSEHFPGSVPGGVPGGSVPGGSGGGGHHPPAHPMRDEL